MSAHINETISTLKFADRAKQIMVKVQANAVSAADDALVMKLQREVQHLKEILNLNRKGGVLDVHQQLLVLKEENTKLKDMASKVAAVEQLKHENKNLRLELQDLRARTSSDTFKEIGLRSGIGGYGTSSEMASNPQPLALNSIEPRNANERDRSPIADNDTTVQNGPFFMTETDNFRYDQSPNNRGLDSRSPINQPQTTKLMQ